jgi:hypothetical protein
VGDVLLLEKQFFLLPVIFEFFELRNIETDRCGLYFMQDRDLVPVALTPPLKNT